MRSAVEAEANPSIAGRLRDYAVRSSVIDWLILLLLPWALMQVNDSWTFLQPVGTVDPWLYTGYFLDLHAYLKEFPGLYYGSRLPWLLLGSAVHSLFGWDTATLVLRLILFYGGTVSLYVATRALCRSRAGSLCVAVLLGVYTPFLQSIGWDYPDGATAVCLLIATAFLGLAVTHGWWRVWLFAAGAALVTAPSIQIFVTPIALVLIGGYCMNNLRSRRDWVESAEYLALGGVLAFGIYGAFNRYYVGDFFYPRAQIHAARNLDLTSNVAIADWLPIAGHLVVPAIATVVAVTIAVSTLTLLRRTRWRTLPDEDVFALSAALQLLSVVAYFVAYQASGAGVLYLHYYASLMIGPVFLVLGAALAVALKQAGRGPAVALVAFVVLVIPLAWSGLRFLPACSGGCTDRSSMLTATLLATGLLVVAYALVRHGGPSRQVASVVLAVAALVPLSLMNARFATYVLYGDVTSLRRQSQMAFEAHEIVRQHSRSGQVLFWYNAHDPYGLLYIAINSMSLDQYTLLGEDLPERSRPGVNGPTAVYPGTLAVILSTDPNIVARVQTTLAKESLKLEVGDTRTVTSGPETFTLTFVRFAPL